MFESFELCLPPKNYSELNTMYNIRQKIILMQLTFNYP